MMSATVRKNKTVSLKVNSTRSVIIIRYSIPGIGLCYRYRFIRIPFRFHKKYDDTTRCGESFTFREIIVGGQNDSTGFTYLYVVWMRRENKRTTHL